MPRGKYFFIQSKMNGLVLDVRDNNQSPGAEVITWGKQDGEQSNQLWWQDMVNKTIRSKLNNFCLDLDTNNDNAIVLNPFQHGERNQQWVLRGDNIVNNQNSGLALDIAHGSEDPGANIIAYNLHGNPNQQWEFEYVDARYFFIQSELNGKVLDIAGNESQPGAAIIMYEKQDGAQDNQLWYEDERGNIRSKLNQLCMDASGAQFQTCEHGACEHMKWWVWLDNRIVHCHDSDVVMDIAGCCEDDGAKVLGYSYNGGSNQHWMKIDV